MIELNNMTKVKGGKQLLHNISWQIQPGEKWLVYGMNGAGKSTLLNVITAYDFASKGEVCLFGMKPGHEGYSAYRVREQIGYVSGSLRDRFAEGELVRDVVLSGIYKSIGVYQTPTQQEIEKAQQVLCRFGMSHFEESYFGQLSTGEQQRVLLARALVTCPRLLILDEPCNGLDYVGREQLLDMIVNLQDDNKELAVIYVTHVVEEVTADFTHALLLNEGKVQKSGELQHTLTSQTLTQLFEMPVQLEHQKGRYQLIRL
ncbi:MULTISPECIES: ABC transporter ATP-binding protein [unclassified Staphylococcus]|uniref:ABC transporter ATP-binding protein n=1 Tax=unclassified Staphylococcus TaxID=91994 RepID=UPI0021D040EC|nr:MULTISPECIES: ABC transporter ATP-binding protein [unclassified Staphylococcus]UXR77908.1 ABC transporter ATP-binding protein [Staphylococcus sp. IVB6227]UXR82069.1 ABC transporter ATP-binding protein [Staphylococcus sp. IVB6214]